MSTPRTAQIYITNTTDGQAAITLMHSNSDYGLQQGSWTAAPGQTVGPLTVNFNTGFGSWSVFDYWACEINVTSGSTPGLYESSGVLQYSDWKECQLQAPDAGQSMTFQVDTRVFTINLVSGGTSTPMNPVDRVSAQVYVTNASDGDATITLFHNNSTDGTQSATWSAAPGQTVGPLTVYFRLGLAVGWVLDYWALKLAVSNGSAPGVYQSVGSWTAANWKECQLQKPDVGQTLTFSVDTSIFDINLVSGGTSTAMSRVGPYGAIDNVFVLMLENHSFDNMLAFSKIPGLTVATTADSNSYKGVVYNVGSPAPLAMPTDPGHEFGDVLEQLCGQTVQRTPWTAYNTPIDSSGFVANYATTRTEITPDNPDLPKPRDWGNVMLCLDTQSQLPVLYQLATSFAVCDRWHSSIPGPTWPNRFFVHGASSGGWADSPSSTQIGVWEGDGFVYPSGQSIYDKLSDKGLQWRIYADENGPILGGVPQVSALKGITYRVDTHALGGFAADLQGPYPYAYTFIEPNYGDVYGGSYTGGSSQHPMDSVLGGETLIKTVYEAIRNSPVWQRSLLIITYDEHGGFYDSVQPPQAVPPQDGSPQDIAINSGGFLFDQYGVRVPAVIVSPLIPPNTVDHTLYDHASVSATLNALYGTGFMTQRDQGANDLTSLLSMSTPRTDCPTTLVDPAPGKAASPAAGLRPDDASPLPESGNAIGLLQILMKTDIDLTRGDPDEIAAIKARVAAIKTIGQAEAYALDVAAKANLARAAITGGAVAPSPGRPSGAPGGLS